MCIGFQYVVFFFFKQKPAYEMRISDWSSDVCSSDLCDPGAGDRRQGRPRRLEPADMMGRDMTWRTAIATLLLALLPTAAFASPAEVEASFEAYKQALIEGDGKTASELTASDTHARSEEHTSELQSLMRISYAVFCLKKKK